MANFGKNGAMPVLKHQEVLRYPARQAKNSRNQRQLYHAVKMNVTR
jgi:hypothetical protein